MTIEITTLPNGLRVITHAMPHLETVSLGVWVGVGARFETARQNGISHFLEHMAFKGTLTRSAQAIAEEIEGVGGELNAATSLETTAYFARVLKGDERVALGLIADILQNSSFSEVEVEREREVILQEIAGIADSPDEIAYDLLQDAAFPDQPVGRAIIGTPASVKRFASRDLRAFLAAHYGPAGMVFAAAGAVEHEPFVRHVEALFGGLSGGSDAVAESARYAGGARASDRRFEQTHFLLGFEGPHYYDESFYTAQVFSGLLGGGMSSRLFQEVRERRGLCYSIYSSAWGLRDAGLFAIHAATGQQMMAQLIDVVGAELRSIATGGPTAEELARAKAQLKAGLMMSLESSSARAEQMARQVMIHGRPLTSDELISQVESVTVAGIRDFAAALISRPASVAVVGAGRASRDYADRAARSIAA
jgi:predicted Zn-dependent peptidase